MSCIPLSPDTRLGGGVLCEEAVRYALFITPDVVVGRKDAVTRQGEGATARARWPPSEAYGLRITGRKVLGAQTTELLCAVYVCPRHVQVMVTPWFTRT